jgi:eukaryotic-like serine/threonine-protein kinase
VTDKTDRFRQVEEICQTALDRPPADREAFLREACSDDEEVRQEVEAVLSNFGRAEVFLEQPVASVAAQVMETSTDAVSATTIALTPGEIFDGRYRIANLIGRGGMGDVYRADDIRVGQLVALKFLSYRSPVHARRIERFFREVRLARQIAHPNVCRVYDIGECDGRLYLSMEYIQGEDLDCLLKRVGPLPREKALDVAHQLCAGLAAAHERGVVHLDLKPANVMIDGRGRAVITDFGVARTAEEQATITIAGTPAYMAPEQLAGGPLTVQTDLYALGLIIRELFTGSPGRSSESGEGQRDCEPLPASRAGEIDPQVEAAIQSCLEREMEYRPRSALAVASALPRGEAFAAALAAGRTPSPEMVAAATREALRPAVAALLAATLVGGILLVGLLNRLLLPNLAPPLSPPVLAARAHEIIQSLGYAQPPADSAYWFTWDSSYGEQVHDRSAPFHLADDGSPDRTSADLRFVYRQSPVELVPANLYGIVLYRDPPADLAGMVDVNLDSHGRLARLTAIPPDRESLPITPPATTDWRPLLEEAGLRYDTLSSVPPTRTPPVPYDVRADWEIVENASSRRATAAAFEGTPVYFEIETVGASAGAARVSGHAPTMSRVASDPTFVFVATTFVLVGAVLIARRHILRGQADTRGVRRLVLYFFIVNAASRVLLPDHVSHFGEEYFLAAKLLAWSLYWCALAAVVYLAFEPPIRRRWPAILIAWNRVLTGRVRDPVVGRDLLIGTVAGVLTVCFMWLAYAEATWLNLDATAPLRPALESFREPRHFAGLITFLHAGNLANALAGLFLLAALDRVLRVRWFAVAVWSGVFLALSWPALIWGSDWRTALQAGLAQTIFAAALLCRCGPIALAAMFFTRDVLTRLPAALEMSAWYSNRSLISLAIVLAIGLYAARIAGGYSSSRSASR